MKAQPSQLHMKGSIIRYVTRLPLFNSAVHLPTTKVWDFMRLGDLDDVMIKYNDNLFGDFSWLKLIFWCDKIVQWTIIQLQVGILV